MSRYEYYQPSMPKPAKGGIKARSRRGAFVENWWAQQWLNALSTFTNTARLQRGRSYARKGQVLSLEIGKGEIQARVQGSRAKPYRITIKMDTFSAKEWQKVVGLLNDNPLMLARLLAGEMPTDMVETCSNIGLHLFPHTRQALYTNCTCPDWENPCKHLAAVFYLVGEELDRDPFLIFTLRGCTRDELAAFWPEQIGSHSEDATDISPKIEPLVAERLWQIGEVPNNLLVSSQPPAHSAPLLVRLENPPLWRGEQPLCDQLIPLYRQTSANVLSLVKGELTPRPLDQLPKWQNEWVPANTLIQTIYQAAALTRIAANRSEYVLVLEYAIAHIDLSPVEVEVANYFLDGLSQTQLAEHMQLPLGQVRQHLLSIGQKVRDYIQSTATTSHEADH